MSSLVLMANLRSFVPSGELKPRHQRNQCARAVSSDLSRYKILALCGEEASEKNSSQLVVARRADGADPSAVASTAKAEGVIRHQAEVAVTADQRSALQHCGKPPRMQERVDRSHQPSMLVYCLLADDLTESSPYAESRPSLTLMTLSQHLAGGNHGKAII